MSIQDMETPEQLRERQRAWELLARVEGHPRVQAWLEQDIAPSPAVRQQSRRYGIWAAAATVVLGVGLSAGVAFLHSAGSRYTTGIGEQRDVVLPDGSKVTLNTDTELRVRYSDERRYVTLERGEALFSVKHDPGRPFDVVAGDTLTRVVGTKFNVDLRGARITVSVLEGAVHVAAAGAGGGFGRDIPADLDGNTRPVAALRKGQALEFDRKGGHAMQEAADVRRIDAWRTRRLEFNDTPLAEAVEEFNRYSTTRVTVGSPELASVRVSGLFHVGDADGFLFSLREALHIETRPSGNEILLLPAP